MLWKEVDEMSRRTWGILGIILVLAVFFGIVGAVAFFLES
ncbi:hypothetical protein KR50_09980 [Jeotgalibacillus campisalis]|uniref:Uncharacterized protein n=1 Tax=Jeotgalibacillus campisalis TaxID=220754 RepID=A0A0C2VQD9_9BACL|nr:hypothetical protein KR50_09980 [Jeotgalibacillus campisalis]